MNTPGENMTIEATSLEDLRAELSQTTGLASDDPNLLGVTETLTQFTAPPEKKPKPNRFTARTMEEMGGDNRMRTRWVLTAREKEKIVKVVIANEDFGTRGRTNIEGPDLDDIAKVAADFKIDPKTLK